MGAPAVDWARVLTRCSPATRKKVLDVRSRYQDLRRLLDDLRTGEVRVDVAHYEALAPSAGPKGRLFGGLLARSKEALARYSLPAIDTAQALSDLSREREVKV